MKELKHNSRRKYRRRGRTSAARQLLKWKQRQQRNIRTNPRFNEKRVTLHVNSRKALVTSFCVDSIDGRLANPDAAERVGNKPGSRGEERVLVTGFSLSGILFPNT